MSIADIKYKELITDIHLNGVWDTGEEVRAVYKDGTPAYCKSVFGRQVTFEEGELPLVTCKQVYWRAGFKELYLFWIKQSTSKKDFEDIGLNFWNEWLLKDGPFKDTLGTSYPYQFERSGRNQVKDLLQGIINNPKSKRLMTSFWNYDEVEDKALQECAWFTNWHVRGDKLDMILGQRSCDLPLGLPTNWSMYKALQDLVAHCTGYKSGRFIHQLGNVHYYDRHEEDILKVLSLKEYEQPSLEINKDKSDFFEYLVTDLSIVNYKHGPFIPFEIAI